MMLSKPQGRKETELRGAHEVVLLGRTDIAGVVMSPCGQGFRCIAGQRARIIILGAVHVAFSPDPNRNRLSSQKETATDSGFGVCCGNRTRQGGALSWHYSPLRPVNQF